jgi:hypothetical protein
VIDADAAVKLIVVNVAPVAAFGTPELPDDLAIAADRLEPRGLKSWQRDQARLSARATAARAGVQRIRVAVSGGGHGASFPAHTGGMSFRREDKAETARWEAEKAGVSAQNSRGEWVPSIPLPFYGLRKGCSCGRKFWTMDGYQGHYALCHILYLA